jgi:hypothetical protein
MSVVRRHPVSMFFLLAYARDALADTTPWLPLPLKW